MSKQTTAADEKASSPICRIKVEIAAAEDKGNRVEMEGKLIPRQFVQLKVRHTESLQPWFAATQKGAAQHTNSKLLKLQYCSRYLDCQRGCKATPNTALQVLAQAAGQRICCDTLENSIALLLAFWLHLTRTVCRLALACVLDGHAGSKVAAFVGQHLHDHVLDAGLLPNSNVRL